MSTEAVDLATLEQHVADTDSAPDDNALRRIAQLAERQRDLEDRIEHHDEIRKNLTAELQKVSTNELPSALAEVGMSSFTLTDGSKVGVRPFLSINVSARNPHRDEAYTWLETEGGGADLLQRTVGVSLGKDSTEAAEQARAALAAAGLEPFEDVAGNNNTIKAHLKVLIESGQSVPLDLFQGHMGQVTKIERPKK